MSMTATPGLKREFARLYPARAAMSADCSEGHVGPFAHGSVAGSFHCDGCGLLLTPVSPIKVGGRSAVPLGTVLTEGQAATEEYTEAMQSPVKKRIEWARIAIFGFFGLVVLTFVADFFYGANMLRYLHFK